LVLVLLVLVVNGQETEAVLEEETSWSTSCVTDGLEPALQLEQRVTTLHIRMPSFWCEGTLPNDFVFTIEPILHPDSSTTTRVYTLPTLHTPLLQANQTTTNSTKDGTTTVVTVLSKNTEFSLPGSFGVAIQVPAHDLQTVIVERSPFWDRASIKVRITPGFTALRRIVSQTLEGNEDLQGIELEADLSTSTTAAAPSPVTLDLLHHGTYRIIGNVDVLNVRADALNSNTATAPNKNTAVVVQILGNVHGGNITRAGNYTILGNITGLLRVNTTATTTSRLDSSSEQEQQSAVEATLIATTRSCENVALLGRGYDEACRIVPSTNGATGGPASNNMTSNIDIRSSFFALECTLLACQETGTTYDNDNDTNPSCQLLTSCPVFGHVVQVSESALSMPEESSSAATTTAAGNNRHSRRLLLLFDLFVLALSCWRVGGL
jgi:hypothetical protein